MKRITERKFAKITAKESIITDIASAILLENKPATITDTNCRNKNVRVIDIPYCTLHAGRDLVNHSSVKPEVVIPNFYGEIVYGLEPFTAIIERESGVRMTINKLFKEHGYIYNSKKPFLVFANGKRTGSVLTRTQLLKKFGHKKVFATVGFGAFRDNKTNGEIFVLD